MYSRGPLSKSIVQFLFLGCFFAVCPAVGSATVQYNISLAQPEKHLFHVTMRIPPVQNRVFVQLPAWNALYQIRDFAHRVAQFRAHSESPATALLAAKLDKQTWQIASSPGEGNVEIQYDIYWDDSGPFNSQLNSIHAFLNLAEVLMYVTARREESVEVRFDDVPEGWSIATSLKRTVRESVLFYYAENYDQLVDSPLEISSFQTLVIQDHPRITAIVHGDNWKPEQIVAPLRKICAYEIALMHDAPFEEYVFIFHIGSAAGGGGMEHASSTAISLSSIQGLPGVSAHEFFHLWNVKRIRPQSLEPVNYVREMWTRSLWFAEGVTSTYGAFTLLRSGIWSKDLFYADLGGQITELELRPANRWKSVEEASLDAWFEKYPVYTHPNLSISYYTKGQILGVLLDILIRDATDNRQSLDDMMRALNDEFAKKSRFYTDSDLRAMAARISGTPLQDFFTRYVSGTDTLPYQGIFARAGLVLKTSQRDLASFGFWTKHSTAEGVTVAQVEPGGNAARAGLQVGDILLMLNGAAFPQRSDRWLREHSGGEMVKIRFRRGSEQQELAFVLDTRIERTDQIEEIARADAKQKRIREGLLRGVTSSENR